MNENSLQEALSHLVESEKAKLTEEDKINIELLRVLIVTVNEASNMLLGMGYTDRDASDMMLMGLNKRFKIIFIEDGV